MALKLEYTSAELIAEFDRQAAQAQATAAGLTDAALNWQPSGGKSWSVAQCLDHLAIMNRLYMKALRDAVENNRDQLEPRRVPIQPSGWFMRWFIGTEEPPPKFKLPAPKKLAPPSRHSGAVVDDFVSLQKQLADFVREWGETDLNDLKMKNPLAPIQLKADTALLLVSYHNRRHLWQAENVKKNVGFPSM
jgi:hypothetical protein